MNVFRPFQTAACGLTLLFSGCSHTASEQDSAVAERAMAFAQSYYNLDRQQAMQLCTREHQKTLDYFFSNITADDLAAVGETPAAGATFKKIVWENDSSVCVTCRITHGFAPDSIGRPLRLLPAFDQAFRLVRVSGEWFVRTADPRQNEK